VERKLAPWLRALGGAVVLAAVVWWVGTGPFLTGIRAVNGPAVLLALAAGVLGTLCLTWRWRYVSGRFGLELPWRPAFAAYYQSQFLNATLPTGVLGDVDRAVRQGRGAGDLVLGARVVVVERTAGLAAQLALAAVALALLRPPLPSAWLLPLAWAVAVVALVTLSGLLPSRAAPGRDRLEAAAVVVVSSGVALGGNLAVFMVAARSTGVTAPLGMVAVLTLLALFAMVLPLSLAGWGPREGVAAWAFAAAGLGAGAGVATAVAYGVLSLVGVLPGAAVLARGVVSRA
jgi:uncharacterized membrane protein YbhN (UPF0104 family)